MEALDSTLAASLEAQNSALRTEGERERDRDVSSRDSASHSAETCHFSELRIVLLGIRGSGKSSAGNTILGRKEFESGERTAQCVRRQGEVAGKQVIVVDTPGWWRFFSKQEVKDEIVQSVSLCPPGPHAILLVINVNIPVTEVLRRSVEEHLELLSERAWRYSMVLFTRGDWLEDTTIEQHIEKEGKPLQWLVEKCGKRYHVLNNKKGDDATQVTGLLEKIEEMAAGNSCLSFTAKEKQELEEQSSTKKDLEKIQSMLKKLSKDMDSSHQPITKANSMTGLTLCLVGGVSSFQETKQGGLAQSEIKEKITEILKELDRVVQCGNSELLPPDSCEMSPEPSKNSRKEEICRLFLGGGPSRGRSSHRTGPVYIFQRNRGGLKTLIGKLETAQKS